MEKILIVDDSNINRYVIKKTIENLYGAQYIIEEADNGLNAIEKCKVEEYRIIFIDNTQIEASSSVIRDLPHQKRSAYLTKQILYYIEKEELYGFRKTN
jgi:DNA-binding NarL/FixJ family response regulator